MRRRPWEVIEILSEEEAKRIVGPYLKTFRTCIEGGLHSVEIREKADDEFFHVYPAGARATIVFWQIVHRAETMFHGMDGVSISHNRGFLTILVADKLEIRFKKLTRRGRSRNYPTRNQQKYSLQLTLPGMDEPTRATAGYQLELDGTLKDILMVCPKGDQLEWSFSLPMDEGDALAHPAHASPQPDEDKPKVRPKQA